MRTRLVYLVLFVFAICISSANAKLFNASEFFLANGLRVIVIQNSKAPIVKHMVWYKAGGMDDKQGKAGTAHLLEHLMFRGTRRVRDGEFNRIVFENGGQSNAFTGLDYTAYHQLVDVSRLELVMALEADRMQGLSLSDKVFEKEKMVVFQERKQVVENNPASEFYEAFRHNLWQNHPYSRPIIGTEKEILSLKRQDIKNFYNRHYAPNNAVLVLSGDIDVETAKILAVKYYGKLKAKNPDEDDKYLDLNNKISASLEMSLPYINSNRLVKTYVAPSYVYRKDKVYALSVFAKYLGDGESSYLYKKLVLDKKNALAVASDYDFASRSYSSFSVSAAPRENVDLEEFGKSFENAIAGSIQDMTPEDIEIAKKKMLAGLVYLRDNPEEAAMIAGAMATVGMSLNEIENYADALNSVTHMQVKEAAESLLNGASSQTGMLKRFGK